ncbi:MAG: HEAT repeat domain-containing protein [Planctomycetes bacterium]|jgi:HEAT repeat protein|nr:HEAT repeat domain-containing protein [Planctomycetota bacterium]
MARSTLAARALLVVLGCLSSGTADAGRLGGACRMPYRLWWGTGARSPLPWPGATFAPRHFPSEFWTIWFEYEKERILDEHLARTGRPPKPPLPADLRDEVVIPLLSSCLSDPVSCVRDAAALALGKCGTPAVVPLLVARLGDRVSEVVEDATLALGLTGEPSAMPPLLGAMGNPRRRACAALALALLGRKEALPAILDRWREPSGVAAEEETAACLATAIGVLGGPEVARELARPLWRQPSPDGLCLQVHVCQALGRLGGDMARDRLTTRLIVPYSVSTGPSYDVQAAAAGALGAFPEERVVEVLLSEKGVAWSYDEYGMRHEFALLALARIAAALPPGDPLRGRIVEKLSAAAQAVESEPTDAGFATVALGLLGSDAPVDFFLANIGKAKRTRFGNENHSAMVMSLALLSRREAVPDLMEILASTKELPCDYRGYAALALGILGGPEALAAVRAAVREPGAETPVLRLGSLALGLSGDGDDLGILLELLARQPVRDPEVPYDHPDGGSIAAHDARGAAALAIGMIGDPSAVAALAKIVRSDAPCVTRAFAVAALGALADRERFPRLPRLLAGIHHHRQARLVHEVLSNL